MKKNAFKPNYLILVFMKGFIARIFLKSTENHPDPGQDDQEVPKGQEAAGRDPGRRRGDPDVFVLRHLCGICTALLVRMHFFCQRRSIKLSFWSNANGSW